MDKRIKIGLLYAYDENWIGGTYYLQNIINALNSIEDKDKPLISIFCKDSNAFEALKTTTAYPYLINEKLPEFNIGERIINKLSRTLFGKNIIKKHFKEYSFVGFNSSFDNTSNQTYWIPDFQEYYFPSFFSKAEIQYRKEFHQYISNNKVNIYFSSVSAQKDFNKFYPYSKATQFLLPFAVTHPAYKQLDLDELKNYYSLPEKYFFCPNQIWIHKNHIVILKAIKILKQKGINIFVAFSGKEYEFRHPDHFNNLMDYIKKEDLLDNIKFLGFIDRKHQLKLMSGSLAILQPSLFEGWSTVVEDAKAMNQFTIASNLNVHKEQLNNNYSLFDPTDPSDLAEKIKWFIETSPTAIPQDYSLDIKKFGYTFLDNINKISKANS